MSDELTPGDLARIDQAHAAAMADLDAFVAQHAGHVQRWGSVAACAVLSESIIRWQTDGEPGWAPVDVAMLAAQAVTRLAEIGARRD